MFSIKTYRRPAILARTSFMVLGYMSFGLFWVTACALALAARDALTGKRPIVLQLKVWRREIANKGPARTPCAPAH